ncbi:MAG TPA: hypothetical protein DCO83_02560 [Mucilaginibacter sp.]|nr:hypothetical protein [Mucilaginibacter sp.]
MDWLIKNFVYLFIVPLSYKRQDMQTIDINKRLVDSYLDLLENLSPNSKLDLISRLSDSLKSGKKNKVSSLKSLSGDFIEEKSAEEIIDDLKKARNFTRKTESF